MAMNSWLADVYNTNAAAVETQEKTAELELFAKLAADTGIDLASLTPEQVHELYQGTIGQMKLAEGETEEDKEEAPEPPPAEKSEEEKAKEEKAKMEFEEQKESAAKVAQAQAEHAAQRDLQAKIAEADLMGRVMAHSLVNELGEIDRDAKTASPRVAAPAEKTAAPTIPTRETSALDQLAAEHAVKLAHAQGWNHNQCVELLNAAHAAGHFAEGGVKTAYVEKFEDAIHVRALEMLEKVGYQINWQEVFGE